MAFVHSHQFRTQIHIFSVHTGGQFNKINSTRKKSTSTITRAKQLMSVWRTGTPKTLLSIYAEEEAAEEENDDFVQYYNN